VHVAVVGYGYWGSKHVRVLSTMPDVAVTVVDRDRGRLEEAAAHYPSVQTTARDVEKVLDRVDAVLVATPPASHHTIGMTALHSGKHVLVEKPLATSVAEAEALVAAAAANDVHLMVGHTFEYNPAVRQLRDIIRSGELGRVLYIDSARLSLGLYQRDVNVIWDLAPHDISITSYLLDELPVATSVWAQRNVGPWQEDVAYLKLDFPTTHAFVHVSWLNPRKERTVVVVGDKKMAVWDDTRPLEAVRLYDKGLMQEPYYDSFGQFQLVLRDADILIPKLSAEEPMKVQNQHFLECVRQRTRPATDGVFARDVVRALEALQHSLRRGGSRQPV